MINPRRRRTSLTPQEQERRARQREMNRQLRVWTPRRVLGWCVAGLAVVVGIVHWLAHLGWRPIPTAMPLQDLVVGYPAAGLLFVVGVVLITTKSAGRMRR